MATYGYSSGSIEDSGIVEEPNSFRDSTQQSGITNKERVKADLIYCGYVLHDIHLSSSLDEFKTQFIKEYGLKGQFTEKDEINIYYKKIKEEENEQDREGTKIDILKETDYQLMLKVFFEDKKKKKIFIETKKLPIFLQGEEPLEFEDEIKNVVERELKIAGNNIMKCLTTNITYGSCKQIRNNICSKCNNQIIGCVYKKVDPNEEKFYCELCTSGLDFPIFKLF